MKKSLFLSAILMAISLCVSAQSNDALSRYMEKYSSNWCRMVKADTKVKVGSPMPEYSFSKKLNSKALRGKTVVLTYWATWCGGCRLLCVDLDSVMLKHSNEYGNVQIIGVDSNEKLADKGYVASEFWKEKGIGFPTTDAGKAADDCAKSINAGHPTTVIIDSEGILRGRWDAWSPGVAGSVALAAWVLDVVPRQGIKADIATVDRLLAEKHYDRALYLLEQMPLDTLSIKQRWQAMIGVSSRHAINLYNELKGKYYNIKNPDQAWSFRPAPEYITYLKALRDVVLASNETEDVELLKTAREAANMVVNYGTVKSYTNSLALSELTLRHGRSIFNRAAQGLVRSRSFAQERSYTPEEVQAIEALMAKYGITEKDYGFETLDHQRMKQDDKEQAEHMSKKDNKK
ncbi:MAG: TlpA family protein disulfide reductase [Prevotella sp.]